MLYAVLKDTACTTSELRLEETWHCPEETHDHPRLASVQTSPRTDWDSQRAMCRIDFDQHLPRPTGY